MKSKREQRHASIIFRNGTPVGFGKNDSEFHAEDNALFDLNPHYEHEGVPRGLTIVNIRITQGGRIGNSKPCPACMELLKEKKFRKVIYSTNEGKFEEIYL